MVSNDVRFVQHILGSTVNGTTYAGIRARTTGALCSASLAGSMLPSLKSAAALRLGGGIV